MNNWQIFNIGLFSKFYWISYTINWANQLIIQLISHAQETGIAPVNFREAGIAPALNSKRT